MNESVSTASLPAPADNWPSFEEYLRRPDTPERLARRAAIDAEWDRHQRETAEHQARVAAVYELADAAPTEEGRAILAEFSAEMLREYVAARE